MSLSRRARDTLGGMRLDAYLSSRVLKPLGMFDTGYSVPSAQKERLAKVYRHDVDGILRPVVSLRGEIVEGEGAFPGWGTALFSTLDDFARFAQMLCNKGELAAMR